MIAKTRKTQLDMGKNVIFQITINHELGEFLCLIRVNPDKTFL